MKLVWSYFILIVGSCGSMVKNPPASTGDVNQSLNWEDALEKEMATHASILA